MMSQAETFRVAFRVVFFRSVTRHVLERSEKRQKRTPPRLEWCESAANANANTTQNTHRHAHTHTHTNTHISTHAPACSVKKEEGRRGLLGKGGRPGSLGKGAARWDLVERGQPKDEHGCTPAFHEEGGGLPFSSRARRGARPPRPNPRECSRAAHMLSLAARRGDT